MIATLAGIAAIGASAAAQRETSLDPAQCASCHAEEARAFARSGHAAAAIDPVFLAEYRPSPDPTCVRCHAPLAPDDGAMATPRALLGVGCAACHVRDGEVLSSRAPSGRAPHASRREPSLATTEVCAGCHQFAFGAPDDGSAPHFDPAEVQQDTVAEWRASGTPRCQRCHMRGEGGGHAFAGLRDEALVRSALRVRARAHREGARVVIDLRLAPGRVGHAIPTGDVFRRLRVTASTDHASAHDELRRFFAPTATDAGPRVREVDDTRVMPGRSRTVCLTLDDAEASRVAWRVEILRLDAEVAHARGLSDDAITILVAEGAITVH